MLNNASPKSSEAIDNDLDSLPIIVLGTGNIGNQFLKILQKHKFSSQKRNFHLLAVANSRYYQLDKNALKINNINLQEANTNNDINNNGELYAALELLNLKEAVVIDLTASEEVAEQYLRFANNGWHIISANKIAAANVEWATSIESAVRRKQVKWLKNTTVGAALPIQDAIKTILKSGDVLHNVTGVFSGSISWLLSHYDGKTPFTGWVKQAKENALTEPDPREDLSGLDVYRKALILARECGFEPSVIKFNPVIPQYLLYGSIEEFWQQENAIDSYIREQWDKAEKNQQKLRYLAEVNANEINIALKAIDSNHPAANLKAGDNIFIVKSDWYNSNPLVIQGPGAGKEVTAAGVFSDLVKIF